MALVVTQLSRSRWSHVFKRPLRRPHLDRNESRRRLSGQAPKKRARQQKAPRRMHQMIRLLACVPPRSAPDASKGTPFYVPSPLILNTPYSNRTFAPKFFASLLTKYDSQAASSRSGVNVGGSMLYFAMLII